MRKGNFVHRHIAKVAVFFLIFGFLSTSISIANSPSLTYEKFESLVNELAPKVNLFSDVWSENPAAEFYGGTSRDFLYWVKDHFKDLKTQAEVDKKIGQLRKLESIDVRDFINGESDVDIITGKTLKTNASKYGVRKIDAVNPDRLNPSTELGMTELNQGYIPIEKIRVGRKGIAQTPQFGNGAKELFTSNITVNFPSEEDFAQTYYAKKKINHRVLLALRYLRIKTIDYYHSHGRELPNKEQLMPSDPLLVAQIRDIIQKAADDRKFSEYTFNPKFKNWLETVIQKTYYKNADAAKMLHIEFGVDKLVEKQNLQPLNQHLFIKPRDHFVIAKNFSDFGFAETDVLKDPSTSISNFKLYHGTRTDSDYVAILTQGVLPSETRNVMAGAGLYSVNEKNIPFANSWGGSENRVVQFNLAPNARYMDITDGNGAALFKKFRKKNRLTNNIYDEFCDAFGVDILKYSYGDIDAFVVKNSAVLSKPEGHKRKILTAGRLLEMANLTQDWPDIERLSNTLELSQATDAEVIQVAKWIPGPEELRKKLDFLLEHYAGARNKDEVTANTVRFLLEYSLAKYSKNVEGYDAAQTTARVANAFNRLANQENLYLEDLTFLGKFLADPAIGVKEPLVREALQHWSGGENPIVFSEEEAQKKAVALLKNKPLSLFIVGANGALLFCLFDAISDIAIPEKYNTALKKKWREEGIGWSTLPEYERKTEVQWDMNYILAGQLGACTVAAATLNTVYFRSVWNKILVEHVEPKKMAHQKQELQKSFVRRLGPYLEMNLKNPDPQCSKLFSPFGVRPHW